MSKIKRLLQEITARETEIERLKENTNVTITEDSCVYSQSRAFKEVG